MAQNSEAIKRMTNQFEQHKNNFCMAKKKTKKPYIQRTPMKLGENVYNV